MTEEQIVYQIRGGQLNDWASQFGIVIALIIIINNIDSFNFGPFKNFPPKLQLLYDNPNQGGYGPDFTSSSGRKTNKFRDATRTAAYKKDPGKNLPTYSEIIKFYDGFEAEMVKNNMNHLLAKHGHNFGIEERLALDPNQTPPLYPQVRTRLNSKNQNQFRENLKSFCQNPKLTVFENLKVRGQSGRGYYCLETNRFIGILTEGALSGKIVKAQPLSRLQIKMLLK